MQECFLKKLWFLIFSEKILMGVMYRWLNCHNFHLSDFFCQQITTIFHLTRYRRCHFLRVLKHTLVKRMSPKYIRIAIFRCNDREFFLKNLHTPMRVVTISMRDWAKMLMKSYIFLKVFWNFTRKTYRITRQTDGPKSFEFIRNDPHLIFMRKVCIDQIHLVDVEENDLLNSDFYSYKLRVLSYFCDLFANRKHMYYDC